MAFLDEETGQKYLPSAGISSPYVPPPEPVDTGGGEPGGGGGVESGGGGGYAPAAYSPPEMPDFSSLFGTPVAAPTLPPKTPYDLNSDPSIVLAKALQGFNNTQLQQQYNLKVKQASEPYIGGGGGGYTPSYAAQIAAAQENAAAEKEKLAHDLPNQLRQIMNQLAAHGLSSSGDASFLPGEANWQYNYNVSGIDRALKQAIAQAQESASNAAAANSGYESSAQARYAQSQQDEKDNLALWLSQQQSGNKMDLAKAYVAAYQAALSNPSIYLTSTGDISSLINKALGG